MNPIKLAGGEHAVLLIHGLQSSPAEMLPLAKRLYQSGYTVHVPHIRGYGYKHGDDAHSITHWEDWHAKALAEFHALKQQYKTLYKRQGIPCMCRTSVVMATSMATMHTPSPIGKTGTLRH